MTDDAMDHETAVELVSCPECGNVASVEWRTRVSGIPCLRLRCIERHWFFLPADRVTYFASDVVFGCAGPSPRRQGRR